MVTKTSSFVPGRRRFLLNILPAGTLFCLGCSNLLALTQSGEKPKAVSTKHKFLEDSGMTYKDIYSFAFGGYIATMQVLAEDIGKDKFIEMLKKASSEAGAQSMKKQTQSMPKTDLVAFVAAFYATLKETPFWSHVLTHEVVEESDTAFEMKITECLWAKTFREANASDIGYASICYPDYAVARAFNSKMRMIRTKTLMQGHDRCNHRYVWEG
jgi:hypothetical protein